VLGFQVNRGLPWCKYFAIAGEHVFTPYIFYFRGVQYMYTPPPPHISRKILGNVKRGNMRKKEKEERNGKIEGKW
jgi:hypothetical protein